jgi:hypothetical protein
MNLKSNQPNHHSRGFPCSIPRKKKPNQGSSSESLEDNLLLPPSFFKEKNRACCFLLSMVFTINFYRFIYNIKFSSEIPEVHCAETLTRNIAMPS